MSESITLHEALRALATEVQKLKEMREWHAEFASGPLANDPIQVLVKFQRNQHDTGADHIQREVSLLVKRAFPVLVESALSVQSTQVGYSVAKAMEAGLRELIENRDQLMAGSKDRAS